MQKPFTLPPRDTWIDHTSILNTDAETLYQLLADIKGWPQWTPGLRTIWYRGKSFPKKGSYFLMLLEVPLIGRLIIPNVVYQNDPHRIEWGGGLLGSTIRHSMEIAPIDGNKTQLRHREYATGLLAILSRPAAGFAHSHDMRWSKTIEARFS